MRNERSKAYATANDRRNARLRSGGTATCPLRGAGRPLRRAEGYLTSMVPFMLVWRPQM